MPTGGRLRIIIACCLLIITVILVGQCVTNDPAWQQAWEEESTPNTTIPTVQRDGHSIIATFEAERTTGTPSAPAANDEHVLEWSIECPHGDESSIIIGDVNLWAGIITYFDDGSPTRSSPSYEYTGSSISCYPADAGERKTTTYSFTSDDRSTHEDFRIRSSLIDTYDNSNWMGDLKPRYSLQGS